MCNNFILQDGWTPLILAIQEERTDIVQLLLQHNANVNTGNQVINSRNQCKFLFQTTVVLF